MIRYVSYWNINVNRNTDRFSGIDLKFHFTCPTGPGAFDDFLPITVFIGPAQHILVHIGTHTHWVISTFFKSYFILVEIHIPKKQKRKRMKDYSQRKTTKQPPIKLFKEGKCQFMSESAHKCS